MVAKHDVSKDNLNRYVIISSLVVYVNTFDTILKSVTHQLAMTTCSVCVYVCVCVCVCVNSQVVNAAIIYE